MFSRTCSARLAPVMTVETFGLRAHHAMESWARLHPRSSATSLRRPTLAFASSAVSRLASQS
jgi:hypothetical protein